MDLTLLILLSTGFVVVWGDQASEFKMYMDVLKVQPDLSQWTTIVEKLSVAASKVNGHDYFIAPTNTALTTFLYRNDKYTAGTSPAPRNDLLFMRHIVINRSPEYDGRYAPFADAKETIKTELSDTGPIYYKKIKSVLYFNGAKVVREIKYDNDKKRVFVLEGVLSGQEGSLQTAVVNNVKFNEFLKLSDSTIAAVVSGNDPYTIFMPSSAALEDSKYYTKLKASAMKKKIANSHFIPGMYFTSSLTNKKILTSRNDACKLKVIADNNGKLFVECGLITARIIETAVFKDDKVVHTIDRVLNFVWQTAMEYIENTENLSEFKKLIGRTGSSLNKITNMLSQPGQVTVFAPINAAFKNLVLPSSTKIAKVVLHHIIAGKLTHEGLKDKFSTSTKAGNSSKETLLVNKIDNNFYVSSGGGRAKVLPGEMVVLSGMVHQIDGVLGMKSHTIYDLIASKPELSTFRKQLDRTGLAEMAKRDGPGALYTFFALNNRAIDQLVSAGKIPYLSYKESKDSMKKFLMQLIVPGKDISVPKVYSKPRSETFTSASNTLVTLSYIMINKTMYYTLKTAGFAPRQDKVTSLQHFTAHNGALYILPYPILSAASAQVISMVTLLVSVVTAIVVLY